LFTIGKVSPIRDQFIEALKWLRQPQHLKDALRFRLFIDEGSPELHTVRWETLWNPEEDKWLISDPRIWFSRFLAPRIHHPILRRPRAPLRALLAVGNPEVLGTDYQALTALDPAAELLSLQKLFSIPGPDNNPVPILVDLVDHKDVTPLGIAERLQSGYDFLCLTCHGAVQDGKSVLWLHEANQRGDWVRSGGQVLVDAIRNLPEKPRLIVLKSCFSADGAIDPILGLPAAIGPALAFAGVPVVFALQGLAPVATVNAFAQHFFDDLKKHGMVDRAAAKARFAVAAMRDPWMPVIFSRLRSGALWHEPTFTDYGGFDCWEAIVTQLEEGNCTAVLGPGLVEPVLGDFRALARQLAEAFQCPLSDALKTELPTVAQCVVAQQTDNTLRHRLTEVLRDFLAKRFDELPPNQAPGGETLSARLSKALGLVRKAGQERGQSEAHDLLARLPIKVYITTNADSFLVEALRAAGRNPREALCRWTDDQTIHWPDPLPPNFEPCEAEPLVFYLCGRWDVRETVVLTESNYFDLLTAVAEGRRELLPAPVFGAAVDSGLIFLGFRLDDWTFRIPFHTLLGHRRGLRTKYVHVATQVAPDPGKWSDLPRARRVLENDFARSNMLIYPGGALDFLEQLSARARPGP
jgi:hypothetical protein